MRNLQFVPAGNERTHVDHRDQRGAIGARIAAEVVAQACRQRFPVERHPMQGLQASSSRRGPCVVGSGGNRAAAHRRGIPPRVVGDGQANVGPGDQRGLDVGGRRIVRGVALVVVVRCVDRAAAVGEGRKRGVVAGPFRILRNFML